MKAYAKEMIERDPVFRRLADLEELLWINENYLPFERIEGLCELVVSGQDLREAELALQRFAPYIEKCFPETAKDHGLIESPLREISEMKKRLMSAENTNCENDAENFSETQDKTAGKSEESPGKNKDMLPGRLFLKMDSHLAIAGSVKARGGIYEVLKHAEDLALEAGKITEVDSYVRFADEDMKEFLGQYTIQVGSTGNLGLSIGIMSACLGFRVKVHMSADARQWKKDLLRSKGVEVIEYEEDYSKAVLEGRRMSDADPMSYFVDDEYSIPLFLGYAVSAGRLKKQLEESGVIVDEDHPLFVYIPCGVGGAPGGICYGLKRVFRDHVHVFFCEPTLFPSVLIGMASGRYERANVADFEISGMSAADGLACASPSGLVTRMDRNLVSGFFTVKDARLFDYLRMLKESENIFIEPSACASFAGPERLLQYESARTYLSVRGIDDEKMNHAAHICWATGGSLVPEQERAAYLRSKA